MTDKSPGMGPWSRISMPKFDPLRERVLVAETKKAGIASEDTRLIPRPPRLIGIEACIHWISSVRSELVILVTATFR